MCQPVKQKPNSKRSVSSKKSVKIVNVFIAILVFIAALFVDVGENFSLLDIINLTFVYDDVGKDKKDNRPLTAVAGKSVSS